MEELIRHVFITRFVVRVAKSDQMIGNSLIEKMRLFSFPLKVQIMTRQYSKIPISNLAMAFMTAWGKISETGRTDAFLKTG
jgi:hypothetical protein